MADVSETAAVPETADPRLRLLLDPLDQAVLLWLERSRMEKARETR